LQAFDFAHLYRNHGCRIQLGGSDQWGNIVAGIDLIKRQSTSGAGEKGEPAYGLTLPLLVAENGEKFGKSAGNAVWLDGKTTSVHDFYQVGCLLQTASRDGSIADLKWRLMIVLLPPSRRLGRTAVEAVHVVAFKPDRSDHAGS